MQIGNWELINAGTMCIRHFEVIYSLTDQAPIQRNFYINEIIIEKFKVEHSGEKTILIFCFIKPETKEYHALLLDDEQDKKDFIALCKLCIDLYKIGQIEEQRSILKDIAAGTVISVDKIN